MSKIAKKVIGDTFVRFEFADGEYIQCDVRDLPNDIKDQLVLHGLSQKGGDSYAGAESVKEARVSCQTVVDNLKAGIWATKASKGGKIVEALSRATQRPFDECLEKWHGMDEAAQKELRKHPAIKKALAEIEAERAASLAAAAADAPALDGLFE